MNRTLARFSRACLLLTCCTLLGLAIAAGITGVVMFPQVLIIYAVVALYFGGRKVRGSGWKFGTARWATSTDLARAGMLEAKTGIPVGTAKPPTFLEAFRLLRTSDDAESACRLFFANQRRKRVNVSAVKGVHAMAVAGAGKGKSTGLVIPFLLTCDDSMVVLDVKGELFKASAAQRRKMGHTVIVIDPFNQTSFPTDRFNPLSLIAFDSKYALDDCRTLANAMVVRTGQEHERHWNDSSENWIAGITGLLASFSDPANRDLQTLAQVLSSTEGRARAVASMQASGAWGGLLSRFGGQLAAYEGKELASVMTTTNRHLTFLSTPAVVESTTASTFDPRGLVTGKMTIYLCIPPDRLTTMGGLLRLWVASLLTVVTRSGLKQDKKIRFVLDEAAALGRMECVEDAISQLRGYGVSFFFLWQSLGQLEKCYPQGQAQTFISNMDVRIFFGLNDLQSAEFVSKCLGETTIQNRTVNEGRTNTASWDHMGLPGGSRADNGGWSVAESGRSLLKPEEILTLSEREAIVLAPSIPPLFAELSPRSYEPAFKNRLRRGSSILLAVRSFLLAVLSVAVLSLVIVAVVKDREKASSPKSPPQSIPVPNAPTRPLIKPRPDLGPGVYTI